MIGGSISCSGCSMHLVGNIFYENIANEGGVMYIESEATLYSTQDYYHKNTALINGGGISATTRSYFSLSNCKFVENYANTDSAVSAEKTSTTSTFTIYLCLFTLNVA